MKGLAVKFGFCDFGLKSGYNMVLHHCVLSFLAVVNSTVTLPIDKKGSETSARVLIFCTCLQL